MLKSAVVLRIPFIREQRFCRACVATTGSGLMEMASTICSRSQLRRLDTLCPDSIVMMTNLGGSRPVYRVCADTSNVGAFWPYHIASVAQRAAHPRPTRHFDFKLASSVGRISSRNIELISAGGTGSPWFNHHVITDMKVDPRK